MDTAGFHALYERHARDVLRFAFYLTGRHAQAEDIAAETFVRAWTARETIRTETVKAYLFSIARNLAREGLRRNAASGAIPPELPDVDAGPAAAAFGRIELRAVLEALQGLPEADRAALLMRAQDGMSHEEIARALGISIAAARVKIHRARLELEQIRIRQERMP